MDTRKLVVRGRVQGVGFRWFVVRSAAELNVQGTVRNRRDGAVEVVAQAADGESIVQLIERIRRGPPGARVDNLECEPMGGESRYDGFEVVR